MNREARRLKASKIATGHNLDDEAQTFLINVLKGSPELSLNSGVISKNTGDKKFIPRIKPLSYIPEPLQIICRSQFHIYHRLIAKNLFYE